ncbi:hypothetical protein B0H21DRAFT_754562 [Amylocystis lapponica]|nr:hypothetical protein B0H21DRAFT_754562 [Amylocystis lapponica]
MLQVVHSDAPSYPSEHALHLEIKSPSPSIFDQTPLDLVDLALATLQSAGVEPVEWRSLLYRRMGVPVLLKNFHLVLPDGDLDAASHILSDLGLPLSPHTKLLTLSEGDFHAKGVHHRLTRFTSPASAQHLVLYPASFASLVLSALHAPRGCIISPSILEVPDPRCKALHVPLSPTVYAALLRTMQRYPRQCATRSTLNSELSELVGYHLLHLTDGFVSAEDDEQWEELGVDRRLTAAATEVRSWTWEECEEWFGDALEAVVLGTGEIDYLPWKSPH